MAEWLDKYGLENVIMITSAMGKTQSETSGELTENNHVSVYSDIPAKRFFLPNEFMYVSNADVTPNNYVKTAEFFYDDFPWDVVDK